MTLCDTASAVHVLGPPPKPGADRFQVDRLEMRRAAEARLGLLEGVIIQSRMACIPVHGNLGLELIVFHRIHSSAADLFEGAERLVTILQSQVGRGGDEATLVKYVKTVDVTTILA